MIVSDSGSNYEQAPIGAHSARCIGLIDIGTQHGEYEGVPNVRRQVIIRWELPDEPMTTGENAGQPFTVSEFFTLSLGEKASLRKALVSWRGKDFTTDELKGFDMKSILGAACMLQVGRNKNDKAKVTAVMSRPKAVAVPAQVNPSVYFSLAAFDQSAFDKLSDGIKGLIEKSDEWAGMVASNNEGGDRPVVGDISADEIPF